jgi:hypothetical protein
MVRSFVMLRGVFFNDLNDNHYRIGLSINFIILQNDQIIYSLTCELGYKLIRMI